MAERNKLSSAAVNLTTFIPWIIYGIAASMNCWRVATGGGLILCLALTAVRARSGISAKLMDWTTVTFFAIGATLMIGMHSAIFPPYSVVVLWSCFAIAAWSSFAAGNPFTTAYGREQAPPEFWVNPIFIGLNRIMTLVWCGLLSINAGLAMAGVIIGGNVGRWGFSFALPMTFLASGYAFNGKFPAYFFARHGIHATVPTPA
ncbi:MAG TPA: hypothetical protein VMU16_05170 [Candidatus Binataceae bacterium]|nr:hypothetical protein [Candidatus Binataceae bacterium]